MKQILQVMRLLRPFWAFIGPAPLVGTTMTVLGLAGPGHT